MDPMGTHVWIIKLHGDIPASHVSLLFRVSIAHLDTKGTAAAQHALLSVEEEARLAGLGFGDVDPW